MFNFIELWKKGENEKIPNIAFFVDNNVLKKFQVDSSVGPFSSIYVPNSVLVKIYAYYMFREYILLLLLLLSFVFFFYTLCLPRREYECLYYVR